MSKVEILDELPRLSAAERAEILDRLYAIEEASGPTEREKIILREAQGRYDADPAAGADWREVEARLRRRA